MTGQALAHVATLPTLEVARDAAARLAGASRVSAVFISGSLLQGLGNHASDIDVYVVNDAGRKGRRQLAVGHSRLDVHEIGRDDLNTAVHAILETDRSVGSVQPAVSSGDLELAVRLVAGEVVAGDDVLGPIRETLTRGKAYLRRHLIWNWLATAHFALEDYNGVRDSGDLDAALFMGRNALLAAGKAIAASAGDLYPGRKWVWRQLDRSGPASFPHTVLRDYLRRDLLAPSGASTFSGLDQFIQTCLAVAATLGWNNVSLELWPEWQPGESGLSRADRFFPRAYTDGVVLARTSQRRVRLAPDAALLWALCTGASRDLIVARATALRDTAPCYARLTPGRSRALLDKLIAADLVHNPAG